MQTIKERPIIFSGAMIRALLEGRKTQTRRVVRTTYRIEQVKCPYGKPGDRLWVRETWAGGIPGCESQGGYSYKADHITGNDGPFEIKWRSPIYMPRNASRITLQVADIRVERLQSITEQDAIAEGLKESPVNAFHALWDSIHADGKYPWDSNPWVWVIEFNVLAT